MKLYMIVLFSVMCMGCVPKGNYVTCPYNTGQYLGQPHQSAQQGWMAFNDQRACSSYQSP